MTRINRRDFLKLSAAALGGAALTSAIPFAERVQGDSKKTNIILLLLDSMSAKNLSLYGYVRETTPNLERLASRATVFHSHYSGGNFTTSGTASTLMGLYPWTSRALDFRGMVKRSLVDQSLFGLLGDEYYRLAYTQNILCEVLLRQFGADIHKILDVREFSLQRNLPMPEENFPSDYPMAYYSFGDFLGASEFNFNPGSLSLGFLDMFQSVRNDLPSAPGYPLGYPSIFYSNFTMDAVMAGLTDSAKGLAGDHAPFLAYYHLMPPHTPYQPRRDFLDLFIKDGVDFPAKPPHPLSESHKAQDKLDHLRMLYDAFIADLDREIGLFVRALNKAGLLQSSYLVITSDHGELFERAEHGHGTALLYEPVIKIPLMILAPGQTERRDVHVPTSNVDLVPTLLHLAGRGIPASIEGRLLPGLGGDEDPERSVFSVFAKHNSSFLPLDKSSVAMIKGAYKMIYYRGYPDYDQRFELYNLQDDPEELRNLIHDDSVTAALMKDELVSAAQAADEPFRRKGEEAH
jgi:arylsulfatase A-like enzyme